MSTYVKVSRPRGTDGEGERWAEEPTSPTLNGFDQGDGRAVTLVLPTADGHDDELLPDGLSSNRYRCIGNGVVAPVAEWIGARLAAYFAALADEESA